MGIEAYKGAGKLLLLVHGGCVWMPKTGYRKHTSQNFVEKSNLSDTGRADRDMLWSSVFTNCTHALKRSASELLSLKR